MIVADVTAQAVSEKLIQLIRNEITQTGPIAFARYMQLALYAPGLGYYTTGSHKLGKGGDFITAPEISPLFSACIAKQCQEVLQMLEGGSLLELGAGTGKMAADILLELEKHHSLPEHYFILDLSADFRQRQQEFLRSSIPHLFSRIHWLDNLPETFSGVILANEVLDAMPVHKFKMENKILKEMFVDYTSQGFSWKTEVAGPELKQAVDRLTIAFTDGYESEINLTVTPWIKSLSEKLAQGMIMLIDYGFPQHEYYHPERNRGTVMCHYRHHVHSDPLLLTGLQDITAHVDFTSLCDTALQAELKLVGYTTQASFLLSLGLCELAETFMQDDLSRFKINQQIKKLTLPHEMGELFKVIAFTKQLHEKDFLGFRLHDMRARL